MRKIALVTLCLYGCGSDGPLTIEGYPVAFVDAYCSKLVECGLVDNAALCHDLYLGFTLDQNTRDAVNQGKIIFHGDRARACMNATLGSTCDRTDFLLPRSPSAACDGILEGTVGDGGDCAINEECISLLCSRPSCATPDTCCRGTCRGGAAPVRPHLGETCTVGGTRTSCIDSYCDNVTLTCSAFKAAGAACSLSSQCVVGSDCINAVCTALAAPGAACAFTSDCLEIGDTCNATSRTCVAVGLTGAACVVDNDCTNFDVCDPSGHCALRPRLGEACPPSCIDNTFCNATTMKCTAPQADGATCSVNRECASNNCNSMQKCSALVSCF
ncbi:MAG: uncharacterized protein JWO36_2387 [Myxococcales bacterium]|nr:uncharacterized protein [Myxococcales bacterium]